MKEIVKVLLQEGIDEETIHEVLSVIEENYEITDEGFLDKAKEFGNKVADKVTDAVTKSDNPIVDKIRKTKLVANTVGKRALNNARTEVIGARNREGQAINQYKNSGSHGNSAFGAKHSLNGQELADNVYDTRSERRQAEKNFHNTVDKYGFKASDAAQQKKHEEYQKTHDDYGKKIPVDKRSEAARKRLASAEIGLGKRK